MATCLDIITAARRRVLVESNAIIPPEEAAEHLEILQGMYHAWVAAGMFGRSLDVRESAAYTAAEQDRIGNSTASPITITLPETVVDKYTGETRPPLDRSLIVVTGPSGGTWVYSSYLASWQRLDGLVLTTFAPLSERFSLGLSASLAIEMTDDTGAQLKPGTVARAKSFLAQLASRYDSPRRDGVAVYF